ncbi:MAG: SDR family oxidoreductase [Clostridiales bacterium]|nr:SDR family oxidoreductase [Clostridiales bacterium]
MSSVIDLSNKTIMITGASSGIGAATALACSRAGAKTILIARDYDRLSKVRESLEGNDHSIYSVDLGKVDEIENAVRDIIAENGPIDGFVHSAGGKRRIVPLRVLKPDAFHEGVTIYLNSFIELCRCITKRNHYNPGLSIVGISSALSSLGVTGRTDYCAAKSGMNSAVKCLAKELAANMIRANVVCPGMVNTERAQNYNSFGKASQDDTEIMNRQFLGVCEPEDVANAVLFLLSDLSAKITGSSIVVDGGLLLS